MILLFGWFWFSFDFKSSPFCEFFFETAIREPVFREADARRSIYIFGYQRKQSAFPRLLPAVYSFPKYLRQTIPSYKKTTNLF